MRPLLLPLLALSVLAIGVIHCLKLQILQKLKFNNLKIRIFTKDSMKIRIIPQNFTNFNSSFPA